MSGGNQTFFGDINNQMCAAFNLINHLPHGAINSVKIVPRPATGIGNYNNVFGFVVPFNKERHWV
jgi:hypothetical protein